MVSRSRGVQDFSKIKSVIVMLGNAIIGGQPARAGCVLRVILPSLVLKPFTQPFLLSLSGPFRFHFSICTIRWFVHAFNIYFERLFFSLWYCAFVLFSVLCFLLAWYSFLFYRFLTSNWKFSSFPWLADHDLTCGASLITSTADLWSCSYPAFSCPYSLVVK